MDDKAVRDHLLELLDGRSAHPRFEDVLADFPVALRGVKPARSPHTPWRLLEHLRIAQWDILEFSRNPDHESPEWPAGYWPTGDAPVDDGAWDGSLAAFRADLQAIAQLVVTAPDLLAPIPGGEGQTLFREVLLVADHNAYHLGQLALVRRLLET